MAGTSSAGFPHLTYRSDAGQFTYHRGFRPDLVPFLAGDLHPCWNRRKVVLDGRRVIKVSLGTGDHRLVIARWEELHPLVQATVREAERDRPVTERLAPDPIRAMAGQVLHTVLADHDRGYAESGYLNGTAQAIGKILSTDGAGGREPTDLRANERAFREGPYRDALRNRRLDRLDLSVTEGEVGLPDEVAERRRCDPASLTDEDLRAIARAPLIMPEVIPSEIDALLAANGLRLLPSPTPAAAHWPGRSPARICKQPESNGRGKMDTRRSIPRPCRPSAIPLPRKMRRVSGPVEPH